jgi:hypothetical protein
MSPKSSLATATTLDQIRGLLPTMDTDLTTPAKALEPAATTTTTGPQPATADPRALSRLDLLT